MNTITHNTEIEVEIELDDYLEEISDWMNFDEDTRQWALDNVNGLDAKDHSRIINEIKYKWGRDKKMDVFNMLVKTLNIEPPPPAFLEFDKDSPHLFETAKECVVQHHSGESCARVGIVFLRGMKGMFTFVASNTNHTQKRYLIAALTDLLRRKIHHSEYSD